MPATDVEMYRPSKRQRRLIQAKEAESKTSQKDALASFNNSVSPSHRMEANSHVPAQAKTKRMSGHRQSIVFSSTYTTTDKVGLSTP